MLSVAAFTPQRESWVAAIKTLWPRKPPNFTIWLFLKSVLPIPGQASSAKSRSPLLKALFQEPLKRRKWKIPKKQAALASWNNTQQKELIFKDCLMDELSRHWNVYSGPGMESNSGSLTTEWVSPTWLVRCSEQVRQYDWLHYMCGLTNGFLGMALGWGQVTSLEDSFPPFGKGR